MNDDLKALIRTIPDFPKPGIQFRDITTLLLSPAGLATCVVRMVAAVDGPVDLVAGVEARGFLFAAALAIPLQAGVVLIRKDGKLPGATIAEDYALEYGTDRIAIHGQQRFAYAGAPVGADLRGCDQRRNRRGRGMVQRPQLRDTLGRVVAQQVEHIAVDHADLGRAVDHRIDGGKRCRRGPCRRPVERACPRRCLPHQEVARRVVARIRFRQHAREPVAESLRKRLRASIGTHDELAEVDRAPLVARRSWNWRGKQFVPRRRARIRIAAHEHTATVRPCPQRADRCRRRRGPVGSHRLAHVDSGRRRTGRTGRVDAAVGARR